MCVPVPPGAGVPHSERPGGTGGACVCTCVYIHVRSFWESAAGAAATAAAQTRGERDNSH